MGRHHHIYLNEKLPNMFCYVKKARCRTVCGGKIIFRISVYVCQYTISERASKELVMAAGSWREELGGTEGGRMAYSFCFLFVSFQICAKCIFSKNKQLDERKEKEELYTRV